MVLVAVRLQGSRMIMQAGVSGAVILLLAMLDTTSAALSPCRIWPSDAAYYLTDKVFTCKGHVTKVHICPSAWPEITLRTLRQVTAGLVIDTGVSRAYLVDKGNTGIFEPPLQYIPGDHLGLEIYGQCDSIENCKRHRCVFPILVTSRSAFKCSRSQTIPHLALTVTRGCYRTRRVKHRETIVDKSSPIVTKITTGNTSNIAPIVPLPTTEDTSLKTPSNNSNGGSRMQSSASAVIPQAVEATPDVLCISQTGLHSSFFYPFLGALLLSAMLLASIVIICCCMLCASCDAKSVTKKDKEEAILDRPTEEEPSGVEPPGNVCDSGSIVPSSGPTIPGTAVTEQRVEESSSAAESLYTSVIPKSERKGEEEGIPSTIGIPASAISLHYSGDSLAAKSYKAIPRADVELQTRVGGSQDQFGEVYKGMLQTPSGEVVVALKIIQSTANEQERATVLKEAKMLGQLDHPHIVKLFGVVTEGEPLMLVSEYLSGGDLRTHLTKINASEFSPKDLSTRLLRFCQDVTDGMRYLSELGVIHHAIAARNILLDDHLSCKITGIKSSNYAKEGLYSAIGGQIPVKWAAPEVVLYNQYTTKSDVWSYGMLMYEIWSLGHKPFENVTTEKLVEIINTGVCQSPPPGCPRGVYAIMVKCWNPDGDQRPSFKEISDNLTSDRVSLLLWKKQQVKEVPSQAAVLGAPLTDGENLHSDLQDTYH